MGGNDLVHRGGRMQTIDEDLAFGAGSILNVKAERHWVFEDFVKQMP